jgi:hypothetical protein
MEKPQIPTLRTSTNLDHMNDHRTQGFCTFCPEALGTRLMTDFIKSRNQSPQSSVEPPQRIAGSGFEIGFD